MTGGAAGAVGTGTGAGAGTIAGCVVAATGGGAGWGTGATTGAGSITAVCRAQADNKSTVESTDKTAAVVRMGPLPLVMPVHCPRKTGFRGLRHNFGRHYLLDDDSRGDLSDPDSDRLQARRAARPTPHPRLPDHQRPRRIRFRNDRR